MHAIDQTSGDAQTSPESSIGLSLVIPAWNEQEIIVQAICEANEALSQLTDDYEIIVIDDGSSDSTADLVRDAAEHDSHLRLVRHQSNLGYGAALRHGFKAATKRSSKVF